jgi:hypothetical protein
MNENNRELLEKVIKERLEHSLESKAEDSQSFKEAMDAISKQIEIDKIDASTQEHLRDEEFKKKEAFMDRIVQVGIFVSGLVVGPIIEKKVKLGYAKVLCEFEKDYTFTTSAGRALSGFFKFKK